MKVRRRFLLALAASLLLHLTVISGPGWHLPTLAGPDRPAGIDARLAAPPRPAAQPRRLAESIRRVPRPLSRKPAVPAVPVVSAVPAVAEKVSDGGTPIEPATPAAPEETKAAAAAAPAAMAPKDIDIGLPRVVRIHYDVTMGERGFVIGQAVQVLRHDGTGYALGNTAETTGLAGLFRPVRVENASVGDIVEGGLRPREFRIERSTGKNEWARFDWQAGRVTGSGGRDFALEPGTQDMLSMFCQLALLPADDAAMVSLPVLTGKRVERYDFEVLGAERIETPRGTLATLHLRNRQPDGKEATDVWLGLDDNRLPVKIRHTDRKGDVFDQVADRIDYDDKDNTEGTP